MHLPIDSVTNLERLRPYWNENGLEISVLGVYDKRSKSVIGLVVELSSHQSCHWPNEDGIVELLLDEGKGSFEGPGQHYTDYMYYRIIRNGGWFLGSTRIR